MRPVVSLVARGLAAAVLLTLAGCAAGQSPTVATVRATHCARETIGDHPCPAVGVTASSEVPEPAGGHPTAEKRRLRHHAEMASEEPVHPLPRIERHPHATRPRAPRTGYLVVE